MREIPKAKEFTEGERERERGDDFEDWLVYNFNNLQRRGNDSSIVWHCCWLTSPFTSLFSEQCVSAKSPSDCASMTNDLSSIPYLHSSTVIVYDCMSHSLRELLPFGDDLQYPLGTTHYRTSRIDWKWHFQKVVVAGGSVWLRINRLTCSQIRKL